MDENKDMSQRQLVVRVSDMIGTMLELRNIEGLSIDIPHALLYVPKNRPTKFVAQNDPN